MGKIKSVRQDKPHPIDLKEFKSPLMQIGNKLDRSIPYLVRQAVKEWIEKYYPEKLVTTKQ